MCVVCQVSPVHMVVYKREWGDWVLSGSHGSVVSVLDSWSLILSSIPNGSSSFSLPLITFGLSYSIYHQATPNIPTIV